MNEQENVVVGAEADYIETIKQLKESTVSKEDYEKLRADNKKLLNTLLEGGEMEAAATTTTKRTSSEIREELFSDKADNFNNLEFVTKALELREAILDEGGIDPFVPTGNRIVPSDDDFAAAERVAEALKSCVEDAQGDSELFTKELMRITVDNAPAPVRNRGVRK